MVILRYEDQPAMVTSSSEVVVIHKNKQKDMVSPQDRAKTVTRTVVLGYPPDPKKGSKNKQQDIAPLQLGR